MNIIVKCVAYIEKLCINIIKKNSEMCIKKNSEMKQKICKVRWGNSGNTTIVINAINSFQVHPNSPREILNFHTIAPTNFKQLKLTRNKKQKI